jgi:hypothetical protein
MIADVLAGNMTHLDRLVALAPQVLPSLDQKLADSAVTALSKARIFWFLASAGEHRPALVFTEERIERASRMLAETRDPALLRATADFLKGAGAAAQFSDELRSRVVARAKEALANTGDLAVGYLLVSVCPESKYVLDAIAQAGPNLTPIKALALRAAAGTPDALLALGGKLELDNRSEDRELHWYRIEYLKAIGKTEDARMIGVLIDALAADLPVPPDAGRPGARIPLDHAILPALERIASHYPELIPTDKMPKTRDAWLNWWRTRGKDLPGLDIRKSAEVIWHRAGVMANPGAHNGRTGEGPPTDDRRPGESRADLEKVLGPESATDAMPC